MDLLLDAGELDQLRGELVGVQRLQRILVLQLGDQQGQKLVEVVAELALVGRRLAGRVARAVADVPSRIIVSSPVGCEFRRGYPAARSPASSVATFSQTETGVSIER